MAECTFGARGPASVLAADPGTVSGRSYLPLGCLVPPSRGGYWDARAQAPGAVPAVRYAVVNVTTVF